MSLQDIMIASIDNTSNAAEWTLAELLNQPELLQKAVDEIDTIVGKDRLVQESDIPHLNYTKACLRESFRLHPVVAFNLPHVSLKDTTVAGYFIPKGSEVLLSRVSLGRNPKVWENPLKFNPDRHLNECTEIVLTEHALRFITFSTGRRGCVASSLGTCMTVMLLARLLQGFKWSRSSPVDLSEAENSTFLATPLTAFAEPRLASHLYAFAN